MSCHFSLEQIPKLLGWLPSVTKIALLRNNLMNLIFIVKMVVFTKTGKALF